MKKTLLLSLMLMISASLLAQEVQQIVIHKKDKTQQVIDIADIDSLTFNMVELNPDELRLSCEINELTPIHATYTIKANQDQDTYYQFIMSEQTYNAQIEKFGSLQEHDQAWWTELSKYYENYTWEDVMRSFLKKGTQTFQSEDIIAALSPNTTYVIYYYGLDSDGNMTTEIGETRFTTPAPQPSDNTFTISNVMPIQRGVKFRVTPTNNDTYFATAQAKSSIDTWLAQGLTMREIAQKVINTESFYGNISQALHSGEKEIEISCSQENIDYMILVCGYNGGVSTDVVTAEFHSLP